MKTEIRCPECSSAWFLESDAGGEFVCPHCLHRIDLASGATASSPEAGPVEAAPPALPDEEVVCPRCQLHFYPRPREEVAKERRQTVLVVEDQEYFRQIAADALEAEFEVQTAATLREAKGCLSAGGIDLIVLDLTLDGDDESRQFLAELTPKPCPVLIYTARDESELYGEDWEELSRLGADDLVVKGMKVDESLVRKTRRLLGLGADDDGPG